MKENTAFPLKPEHLVQSAPLNVQTSLIWTEAGESAWQRGSVIAWPFRCNTQDGNLTEQIAIAIMC